MESVKSILDFISLGKYRPKLYHKGYASTSSICSGLLTVFFGLFMFYFIIKGFYDVLNYNNYTVKQVPHLTKMYLDEDMKIKDLSPMFSLNIFVVMDHEVNPYY